ncbi:MAG: Lrp/AsnC ligand binding domain-containing protein [Acidilobaceae archaeon]|nr:Lrp/AsnC ligand binding domain-containing protein [Acidilobaceae archaeon]
MTPGQRHVVAFILINVEMGAEEEVRDILLSQYKNSVTEARITYGEYDLVVKVEVENMAALEKVTTDIRAISGVRRTVTLIAV